MEFDWHSYRGETPVPIQEHLFVLRSSVDGRFLCNISTSGDISTWKILHSPAPSHHEPSHHNNRSRPCHAFEFPTTKLHLRIDVNVLSEQHPPILAKSDRASRIFPDSEMSHLLHLDDPPVLPELDEERVPPNPIAIVAQIDPRLRAHLSVDGSTTLLSQRTCKVLQFLQLDGQDFKSVPNRQGRATLMADPKDENDITLHAQPTEDLTITFVDGGKNTGAGDFLHHEAFGLEDCASLLVGGAISFWAFAGLDLEPR
ncbi:hypothetical protein DFH09DRAFT_1083482 [Mycena vulgaris]|nr:hypothetical protein DFH09DRAFT_1083482 [Mycena vulgaris]